MSPPSDRPPRAFLAAPFLASIDPGTGVLGSEERGLLQALMAMLSERGWTVDNAHSREAWGAEWMEPEVCTPLDHHGVTGADLLIALPGSPPSGGVHIEIGWASASGVPIVLLLQEKCEYSQLVLGIDRITKADLLWYRTSQDAVVRLEEHLSAPAAGSPAAPDYRYA